MNITSAQLGLLHHSLGVDPRRRTPFRNHYVAGVGHYAQPDLEALEAAGMMRRGLTPAFCGKGDIVYHCTDAGEAYALDNLPQPPKRSRYQQFLDDDYGHSFAEWMGIEAPEIQWSGYRSYFGVPDEHYRYRRREFTRGDRWSPEIIGEWKPTKKGAKESYKAALKARNAQLASYA